MAILLDVGYTVEQTSPSSRSDKPKDQLQNQKIDSTRVKESHVRLHRRCAVQLLTIQKMVNMNTTVGGR